MPTPPTSTNAAPPAPARPRGRHRCLKQWGLVALLLAALLPSASAHAQTQANPAPSSRSDWWFALDAGYARLETDPGPHHGDAQNGWELAFSGGLQLTPQVRMGLKLGGFGLEAGNFWDPSRGESFSQVFLVTQYAFRPDLGWYAHAGAGWTEYVNNSPEHLDWEGNGWGLELGVGYALPAGARWSIAPALKYSTGTVSPRGALLGDFDYSVVSLSLGVCFQ